MSPYLSDKIKVISVIAIIMVIYIHTYYTEGENYASFMFIQRLMGGTGISGIANPLFYFTSGYLFFLSIKSIKGCIPKIKKRIRTLLIPYLLANTIAFLLYATLDGISRLQPSLYGIINFHILDWFQQDVITILKNIYWEPVAFQLWFLKDMLIFVLFTPIIFLILNYVAQKKWSTYLTIAILLASYFFTSIHVIWMAVGGIISLSRNIDISSAVVTKGRNSAMYVCGVVFLIFITLNALGIYNLKFHGYALFGVITAWILYDKIIGGRILCTNTKLAEVCSYSFFIYLIHEPTLLIFKKIPLLLSSNELALTIYFLTIPIIFVSIMFILGHALRKYIPKAFSIYTGGR